MNSNEMFDAAVKVGRGGWKTYKTSLIGLRPGKLGAGVLLPYNGMFAGRGVVVVWGISEDSVERLERESRDKGLRRRWRSLART
jgi:hypothetical protein